MRLGKKFEDDLLAVVCAAAKKKKLLRAFLRDLLTPTEYRDIGFRWQIVQLLAQHIPQHEIARRLKASIVTVSRGSRALFDEQGGFQQMIRRRKLKKK